MATVIDELVTKLGVELDEKTASKINDYSKRLENVAKVSGLISGVVLGTGAAIFAFAQKANSASAELKKFADVSGIAAGTLQEIGYAAEQAGGSFEGIQQDLKGLYESVSSPMPGQFNQGLFMLGVATRKANGELRSADELLLDVADRMKGMSAGKQARWAQEIGLGPDALLLIRQGRDAIEQFRQEARDIPTIISDEDLANAQAFTNGMKAISRTIQSLLQSVAAGAGPIMKELTASFIAFMKQNGKFIKSGLSAFVNGVVKGFTAMFDHLKRMADMVRGFLSPFSKFTGSFDLLEKIITALTYGALALLPVALALVAAKLWAMVAPMAVLLVQFVIANAALLFWVAIIALAALALEDLWTYMQGGDSVIGTMIDDMGAFGTIIGVVIEGIGIMVDGLVMAAKTAGVLAGAVSTMDFSGVPDAIAEIGNPKNSIFAGRNARAEGGGTVNQTFNIQSTDPMGTAGEIGRRSNLMPGGIAFAGAN